MAFTINPAEAQAIQEDEAQLLGAITHATRSLVSTLNQPRLVEEKQPDSLRIQMGRRVVYGLVTKGKFRNELDNDRLKTIFEALQRPVTEAINAEKYRGRVPAIEIRDGDQVLFREERDGVVTVNQIQFQIEQQTQSQSGLSNPSQTTASADVIPAAIDFPATIDFAQQQQHTQQAQELRVLAAVVLDIQGTTNAEGNLDYQSEHCTVTRNCQTGVVSVTRDGNGVLEATREGQILMTDPLVIPTAIAELNAAYHQGEIWRWELESEQPPPEDFTFDWQAQDIRAQEIGAIAQSLLNPFNDEQPLYSSVAVGGYHITQNSSGFLVTRGEADIVVVMQDQQVWDYSSTLEDWQTFQRWKPQQQSTEHRQQTTSPPKIEQPESVEMPAAISILEQSTEQLPDGQTKQLLQATHQTWKQQLMQGLQQGIQDGMNWLSSRPEVWQDQRVARATLELFNRSYARTEEKSYEVAGLRLNLHGTNVYSLSDAQGELMRFQATQMPLPGVKHQTIHVLTKSDRLSSSHHDALQHLRADKTCIPLGDLDIEANYAAKTQRVESIVRQFLATQNAAEWDKAGGRFRFETGAGNALRIIDKRDGRDIVYQREAGRVTSSLGTRDFVHFERLATMMQTQLEQHSQPSQHHKDQSSNNSRVKQSSPGLEIG
jgi:hypothetical protein